MRCIFRYSLKLHVSYVVSIERGGPTKQTEAAPATGRGRMRTKLPQNLEAHTKSNEGAKAEATGDSMVNANVLLS